MAFNMHDREILRHMKKRHFKKYIAPYASSDKKFRRDPNFQIFQNYDADKEFRKMVRLGVFTAIKANGELNEDCEHFYEAHKDNWKNPLKDEQGNLICTVSS